MTVKEFLETVTKEDLLNLWMDEIYQLYHNEGHMPRRLIDKEFLKFIKNRYKLVDYIDTGWHKERFSKIEIQEAY